MGSRSRLSGPAPSHGQLRKRRTDGAFGKSDTQRRSAYWVRQQETADRNRKAEKEWKKKFVAA